MNNQNNIKHCKLTYKVLIPYEGTTGKEVIEFNGVEYVIERLPRPAKNESDLMCVFVSGRRYRSFANFLKTKSQTTTI